MDNNRVVLQGKMPGKQRTPAAVLLLWNVIYTFGSVFYAGAISRIGPSWWLSRIALLVLVIMVFIGKKNIGLLIPIAGLSLLSLQRLFVYFRIGNLLYAAGWWALCLIAVSVVLSRSGRNGKLPKAFSYLPAGLFLAMGLFEFISYMTASGYAGVFLSGLLYLLNDILLAMGILFLARALTEETFESAASSAAGGGHFSPRIRPEHRRSATASDAVPLYVPPSYVAAGQAVPGVLLVRFSIDKLNGLSGSYGFQSGRLIGQAVPAALLEGMIISDGDSAATLAGREYVCVVSIASNNISVLTHKIEPLLRANKEILENGADPVTQVVGSTKEPLVMDGIVRNGRIEGNGGWCANGFISAWKEAEQTKKIDTTASDGGRVTVMAKSFYQPKPEANYGRDIWGIIVSILLIFGGASGQFVLRGTNSSTGLVIAGIAFLVWDIFLIFIKQSDLKKAEEAYSARYNKMREEENAIMSDAGVLPMSVNVRIACNAELTKLDLVPRLNGSDMTWNAEASAYTAQTSSMRNILTFKNLDLSAAFEIAHNSDAVDLELFRDKLDIGIELPENVTFLQQTVQQ